MIFSYIKRNSLSYWRDIGTDYSTTMLCFNVLTITCYETLVPWVKLNRHNHCDLLSPFLPFLPTISTIYCISYLTKAFLLTIYIKSSILHYTIFADLHWLPVSYFSPAICSQHHVLQTVTFAHPPGLHPTTARYANTKLALTKIEPRLWWYYILSVIIGLEGGIY